MCKKGRLRQEGEAESRPEPCLEVERMVELSLEGEHGAIPVPMPIYESTGRLAPRREYRPVAWPTFEEAIEKLPAPVLPEDWKDFAVLYRETWAMLFRLVRTPRPDSGLPGPYISTGSNFPYTQFVWDSSFTAMATAYGYGVIPNESTLDVLYVRQFDGGYIPRASDVRDNLAIASEPDFSPNPPLLSLAEWSQACVSGDLERLRAVYPALVAMHRWLRMNRRLPDGTYWTTGFANGLDNSPSLGDGYPCLTSQMAHDAEILGHMARLLGREEEAALWMQEWRETGEALNRYLWNEQQQFYATSLAEGGHNNNKVVTGFWPLWAGVVPRERIAPLAGHLQNPACFWRHHPVPSLAADSPYFEPEGHYWRGSTWAPTNYAVIKGFMRAGRQDLGLETTLRHLTCMFETWKDSGQIWENYGSEFSQRGSWSMADYCWSALGPIALLLEVVIGLEADAFQQTLHWRPPVAQRLGVRRFRLGEATLSVLQQPEVDGVRIEVETDRPFRLHYKLGDHDVLKECPAGASSFSLPGVHAERG